MLLTLLVGTALASAPANVVNGSTTSDYEAVGVLLYCSSRGCGSFCSGNLVDANWVVTAAHCVDALDDAVRAGYTGYFAVGASVNDIDHYEEIVSYAEHPSYNTSTLRNDIGMVELAGSGITAVTPLPLNTSSVDNSWLGMDLTYVGYGITGDGRSDSGVKRTGDIPVYDYDSYFITAYDGVVNVCQGDSGGAGLYNDGGTWTLAAVNSYVTPRCNGGATGGVRVDSYISWIEGYVNSTSGGSSGGSSSGGSGDGGSSDGGSTGGGSSDGGSTGGSSGGGSGGSSGGGGSSSGSGGSSDGGDSGDGSGGTGAVDTGYPDGEALRTFGDVDSDINAGCSTGAAPATGVLAVFGLLGLARRRD